MPKWTKRDISLWQFERDQLEEIVQVIEWAIAAWIAIGTVALAIAVARL
jgi:hypothetical protein